MHPTKFRGIDLLLFYRAMYMSVGKIIQMHIINMAST
jgi:hypothetical protein